jgi:hypothetical protein
MPPNKCLLTNELVNKTQVIVVMALFIVRVRGISGPAAASQRPFFNFTHSLPILHLFFTYSSLELEGRWQEKCHARVVMLKGSAALLFVMLLATSCSAPRTIPVVR